MIEALPSAPWFAALEQLQLIDASEDGSHLDAAARERLGSPDYAHLRVETANCFWR